MQHTNIKLYFTLVLFIAITGVQAQTVKDIDGNVYKTVVIGTQTWMAENLKTTKYRDGSPISNITDSTEWTNQTTGAYCWYDNSTSNKSTYGGLYNYYAVDDSRNICPSGWHVPTDAEWTTLTDYLGGESAAGGKLKATKHWNTGADNSSGFTAFLGGIRPGALGMYFNIDQEGSWWSSTESNPTYAWTRVMIHSDSEIFRFDNDKGDGISVRCVKESSKKEISAQHAVNTGNLALVEKNAKELNRLHTEIEKYVLGRIQIYEKASLDLKAAKTKVQNLILKKIGDTPESIQKSELVTRRERLMFQHADWYMSKSQRLDDINSKIEENNKSLDTKLKSVKWAQAALALAETSLNIATTTYNTYGGSQSYQNYLNARDNYNKQLSNTNAIMDDYNNSVDVKNSRYEELSSEFDEVNKEKNAGSVDFEKAAAEINSSIAILNRRENELYDKYMKAEITKDPFFGAKEASDVVAGFGDEEYEVKANKWLTIEFVIEKKEKIPPPNGRTDAMLDIYSRRSQPEYNSLSEKINEYEMLYVETIKEFSTNKVTLGIYEVTDQSYFTSCLLAEKQEGSNFSNYKILFGMDAGTNCVDFFKRTLTLDSLVVDPAESRLRRIGLIKSLPSLVYLDISNNEIEDFQPLFDIEYRGWVNISGNNFFKTSELKDICKRLEKEFGAECIHK